MNKQNGLAPTEDNVKVGSIVKIVGSEKVVKEKFSAAFGYVWNDAMRVLLGQTVAVCHRPGPGYFGLVESAYISGQNVWWYPLSVIEYVVQREAVSFNAVSSLPPDHPSEMLVFGYFHTFQKESKQIQIPVELFLLCLKYYHHPEYFLDDYTMMKSMLKDTDCTLSNNDLTFSTKSRIPVNKTDAYRSYFSDGRCVGNTLVPTVDNEYIYKWEFRIVKQEFCMMIGIAMEDRKSGYQKHEIGGYWTSCGMVRRVNQFKEFSQYGHAALEGDVLTMELDTTKGTLRYARNGKDYGIAFNNLKCGTGIFYRAHISIGFTGVVSLVNFERVKRKK